MSPIKKKVHDLFIIENPLCNESIRDFLSGSWRKAAQKASIKESYIEVTGAFTRPGDMHG
jgi:hypothetical protein